MKREYCSKIVRIGAMHPIEGADRLAKTNIDGNSIVVPKGMFKPGEAVIYCANETQINRNFLSANNLFELSEYRLNTNHREVENLLAHGHIEEARRITGHFGKQGRVKMIRLRGCTSYGCIFKPEQLAQWNPKLQNINLEDYLRVDENGHLHPYRFDTIDGQLFVQAYIPRKTQPPQKRTNNKHNQRLQRFDRLIPGQFEYHYETDTLNGNTWRFKPETVVTISLKMHGTSVCLAHVLTKVPKALSITDRLSNHQIRRQIKNLRKHPCQHPRWRQLQQQHIKQLENQIIQAFRLDYGPVWSSRRTIKNRYINPRATKGFYPIDIHSQYGQLLQPHIDKGITLYGEICGYLTGLDRMIMKNYDYGCPPGQNFLTPYRITHTTPDGKKTEWSVKQVHDWTQQLIQRHPELQPHLRPIHILYHGTLGDLYPNLLGKQFWEEHLLQALQTDTIHFGMEKDEPLCRHKVPREGICIRIHGDPTPQCFKLKTSAFFHRETKLIDQGLIDYDTLNS